MIKRVATVLCLGLAVSAAPARSGVIEPGFSGGGFQIQDNQAIGQSFTAIDALVDIDIYVFALNPTAPLMPITTTLYAGDGQGGAVVGASTVTPAAGQSAYVNFFDDVALSVGDIYSVFLESDSPYWAVGAADSVYTGGTAYLNGSAAAPTSTLSIRVTGVAPLPLPPGGVLLLTSLGLMTMARRRKRD